MLCTLAVQRLGGTTRQVQPVSCQLLVNIPQLAAAPAARPLGPQHSGSGGDGMRWGAAAWQQPAE